MNYQLDGIYIIYTLTVDLEHGRSYGKMQRCRNLQKSLFEV